MAPVNNSTQAQAYDLGEQARQALQRGDTAEATRLGKEMQKLVLKDPMAFSSGGWKDNYNNVAQQTGLPQLEYGPHPVPGGGTSGADLFMGGRQLTSGYKNVGQSGGTRSVSGVNVPTTGTRNAYGVNVPRSSGNRSPYGRSSGGGSGGGGAGGGTGGGSFSGLEFTPKGGTDAQRDAYATLKSFLDQYGLGTLAEWAWKQLLENRSPNEIMLALPQQPAYKQRFPAIELRAKAGLPAISPAEYIAYERQARQMFAAAGFPAGMYDSHDDFTAYLAGDKSLAELSQQVALYQKAAYEVPLETRQQLKTLYGVDEGGIAAYFATKEEKLPQLIASLETAGIAGQAQRQRFGQLSLTEAERLRALGVTQESAAQGFGVVDQARELFQALPGEAGWTPGRDEALGFVAGDTRAMQSVDLQARRRRAAFQGSTRYAQTQAGTSGLGSANT